MASLEAGIVSRAHARAQRRFRQMLTDQTYGDPTNRRTILYVQAERLVDALLCEIAWNTVQYELERLQAADPEAPDYFAAFVSESELRLMDGNR